MTSFHHHSAYVTGSYPDGAQLNEHQQHVDGDDQNAGSDCVIPCGHIYDPVCAVSPEDPDTGDAGEVREFPNECTMTRYNCEWKKREFSLARVCNVLVEHLGFRVTTHRVSTLMLVVPRFNEYKCLFPLLFFFPGFQVVGEEHCGDNNDLETTMMPSGAASVMRMHFV